ncbi:hypothetical protein SeH_A4901 [Salmonella enterica subsp. enterica serovar Hadar str. RI_05P066]|uniref:Uncharacterized protein n=1 Tax=Salmonella newport (strain SL254) TaxID=423368 RepID=A0A0H3BLA5_SALNS|nr:hypothetical protein SNSL254_A1052 [Salmonella enterica subsp. enterica serovar Newport str. SL254]AIE04810.1 hypothetical protein DC51_0905 [Salmonella enterica subsp. enterica serovar Typhimurium]EDY29997.1 hypothetical protein SeSB_A2474 [Salmonella enterica subsp. enterica serovar Schwarzengrund str. SL480]EDZ15312.1 hypothetical protein SeI_A0475 [Salmonella enterica subsp. enterica serovar 4 [Salmonella enterica subsp. enterica serovar 4 [Salmonella enterica subsp. enterica serovar 4,[5
MGLKMAATKKAKAAVRGHQRLSGAKTVGNCGDEYVKYR